LEAKVRARPLAEPQRTLDPKNHRFLIEILGIVGSHIKYFEKSFEKFLVDSC